MTNTHPPFDFQLPMSSAFISMPKNDHKILVAADQDADSPPDSPSFPTTSRIDDPRSLHTPPDEANTALLMPANSGHILRRRRSHLKRWIEDQQHIEPDDFDFDDPESPIERVGTPCNPYLAYPHLSVASFHPRTLNEVGSLHNYVVVDDIEDQTHDDEDHVSIDSDGAEHMSPPASPNFNGSPQSFPSRMTNSPSSFRNFHLFRHSRTSAISISGESRTSRNSSRLSLFRSPRLSTNTARSIGGHNKSSSLSTLNLTPQGISSEDSVRGASSVSPSWRWRQSVRGHFSSPSTVPHIHPFHSESRRSISSSTNTYSSALTPPTTHPDEDPDLLSVPLNTVHLNSMRSRGKSPNRVLFRNEMSTASVPSLWSGPTSVSHTPEASGSTSALVHKESAIRIPFSPKGKHAELTPTCNDDDAVENISHGPQIVYARAGKGSTSRVSLSSLSSPRDKHKKKLIVSGIGMNDTERLQAMKKWCESFGEVTQIMRMPNGDLHVHFRKAEAAETVCRLRARVTIAGVGSVQLSWSTGDKR